MTDPTDIHAAFNPVKVEVGKHKFKTERIDEILQRTIEGENLDQLLSSLSADEQNLFYDLVAQLREHGEIDSDDLWKIDYTKRPPTMEEFLDDEYWIGAIARKSEESAGVFPVWREVLCRDFNLDSRLHNVVITGSLGIGKSFLTALIFSYRLVQACLLRNPQAFLGLSRGSMVYYVMLSVTRAQVTETIFGDALNMMANCPFFIEECGYDPKKKYAGMNVPLQRNIFLTAGSQSQHIIGRNTLGVAMDEGNWRREKNPNKSAYKLFDEVRTRLKNRFQKVAGYLPAISMLASSARDESAFTEQVIKDIESVKNNKTERVYRYAAYEVKRHELTLSDRWFKVAYGLRNQDPRVLTGWYDESGKPTSSEIEEAPAGAQVKLVPADYSDAFKRNVTTALQSICGVSTGGSFRLFGNMFDFERAAANASAAGLENPCNVPSIPLSLEDSKQVWDFLDHKKLVARRAGAFVPLRNPDKLRYAHIDLATSSQAGVSICHEADTREIGGLYNVKTGKLFSEQRPIAEYDLVLSIVAGTAKPISFEKIQNLFFWLRERCGYRFGLITADTFQSFGTLQLLESRGFPVKVLSLDRTKEPYYTWREALVEGRVRLFKHGILWNEAEHLIDGTEKIDHPENNSKDVSDSAAGAYFGLSTSKAVAQTNHSDPSIYGSGKENPVASYEAKLTAAAIDPAQLQPPPTRRFGG